jgi:hypothetical protein
MKHEPQQMSATAAVAPGEYKLTNLRTVLDVLLNTL